MSIFRQFKIWRNERIKRLEMIRGNQAYLFNCWLDYDGLQQLFKSLPEDRSATLYALDGTRIEISKANNCSVYHQRNINWDKDD